ncbi:MAG: hypothetical protein MH252_20560 [Thermosynechococcaceae cyanobacterium MS004]|nr:hypothetical protein [Thermosynechococcaceae cyanobacterium MS004]
MNIVTDPLKSPFSTSPLCKRSQLNYFEQIRVLTTHPFFTGRCPACKQKLALVARTPGQSSCACCGWTDSEIPPA